MTPSGKNLLNCPLLSNSVITSEQDRPGNLCTTTSRHYESSDCPLATGSQIEAEVIELLHHHSAALSRHGASMSRDNSIVQDAIQEVFLRYFISRKRGQQIENPRAWLFRVLRNYIFDHNRKSNILTVVGLEAAEYIEDTRQDIEAEYLKNEHILHLISTLTPREKECMQLRLEGFNYHEIAHILEIRIGTVAALVGRGLKKIRRSGIITRKR